MVASIFLFVFGWFLKAKAPFAEAQGSEREGFCIWYYAEKQFWGAFVNFFLHMVENF
jgi:hypothetical protein